MDNSSDKLVLVDIYDREVGNADKLTVHQKGLLHRAFSVFLLDIPNRKMLIQKRAEGKYHSSGLWANTCCSHPRAGEDILTAARRRLNEETGISAEIKELFHFVYRETFENGLCEYEVDHVFVGNYSGNEWLIDPDEVSELTWIDMDHLSAALSQRPEKFASWFITAAPQVLNYMEEIIKRAPEKPVVVEK